MVIIEFWRKKKYTKMLRDAKDDYKSQIQHFSENLPERLKIEYLSFVSQPTYNCSC
jgi:hypothetical protein